MDAHFFFGKRLNFFFLVFIFARKIVLVALQDEASKYGRPVFDALVRLGARPPFIREYRGSFAFAGYAGSYIPSWISQAEAKRRQGPSIVTASVEPGNCVVVKLTCNVLVFSHREGRFATVPSKLFSYQFFSNQSDFQSTHRSFSSMTERLCWSSIHGRKSGLGRDKIRNKRCCDPIMISSILFYGQIIRKALFGK